MLTDFWTVLIEIEKYIVWLGSNKIKSRGDVLFPCKFCHLHGSPKIVLYIVICMGQPNKTAKKKKRTKTNHSVDIICIEWLYICASRTSNYKTGTYL